MTYWHMQLHPDEQTWGRELELLEKKALIGLGKTESNIAYINFKENMKVGDIVAIKRGSMPIALVEVVGEYEDIEENVDRLDWFRVRRKIKILSTDTTDLPPFPQPRMTLQKAINKYTLSYQFIDKWYNKNKGKKLGDLGIKIHSLHIDLHKQFKDFDIDFIDKNTNKPLSLVVIVGKNGTGKTTILDYIYQNHVLNIGAHYQNNNNCIKFFRNNEILVYNNEATKIRRRIDNYLEEESKKNGMAGISYNENGKYLGNISENIIYLKAGDIFQNNLETIEKLFLDYVDYFIYEKSLTAKDGYEALKNDFEEIFEGFDLGFEFSSIDYKNKKPIFKNKNNDNTFSLEGLSTGEKTLLSKILYLYLKEAKNKIILIDEPELSLHPSWQNKVANIYEKFAKINNNQIILATHSPHILSSVDNSSIRVLYKQEDGKIVAIKDNLYARGRDINSILFDVMGEVSYRPKEYQKLIDEMYELIDRDNYFEAIKIYNNLKENFGENDSVVIEAKILLDMIGVEHKI